MVLFLLFKEKVPIGKSTNMVLFPKEKVPYSIWYFFPLVLFPIHHLPYAGFFMFLVQFDQYFSNILCFHGNFST